jgi:energy-coupling factor transport system permease protein
MQIPAATILGQYRPLDSYLHRLDARAKLIPVVLVMVLVLLTRSFAFYGLVLAGIVAGLAASHIGFGRIYRSLRPMLWLVVITALYHVLFSSGGGARLLQVWFLDVTTDGLEMAGYYSLRLLIFVSIAFIVTLTTSPSDMAEAITRVLRPLERLRIPVNDLGLILFLSLRFVPILAEEFTAIRTAQQLRGVRLIGSRIARLRQTLHLLIPVFLAALARADELALAMEARGFSAGQHRTWYSLARFGRREAIFVIWTVAALGGGFWLLK